MRYRNASVRRCGIHIPNGNRAPGMSSPALSARFRSSILIRGTNSLNSPVSSYSDGVVPLLHSGVPAGVIHVEAAVIT